MSQQRPQTLYERALDFVRDRHSVSAQNLKAGLGVTDAQARTFLRVMQTEGVISPPDGVLNRHKVAEPRRALIPDTGLNGPLINIDDPEKSVLYGQTITPEDILTPQAQSAVREIVDRVISLEDQMEVLRDGLKAVTAAGKAIGIPPKALKAAVKVIRKIGIDKFEADHDLVRTLLHAVGELVDDVVPEPEDDTDPWAAGQGGKPTLN